MYLTSKGSWVSPLAVYARVGLNTGIASFEWVISHTSVDISRDLERLNRWFKWGHVTSTAARVSYLDVGTDPVSFDSVANSQPWYTHQSNHNKNPELGTWLWLTTRDP